MGALLTDEDRTARKQHMCDDCERPILPGDRYHFQTVAHDGTVGTWREHLDCRSLYWTLHREWGLSEGDPIDVAEFREELDLASRVAVDAEATS